MKITVNIHGIVSIVLIILLIVFAAIKGESFAYLYGLIAAIIYGYFLFANIRRRENMASDKRRIISNEDQLEILRKLLGWHLFALLAAFGIFLPIDGVFLLLILLVAGIAGLGIPYIVLQEDNQS